MTPIPVLWWNNTVIAANGTAEPAVTVLPQDGDSIVAFCAFLESLSPTPKNIRLIYASNNLEPVMTPCPPGGRARLRRSLASRFPALTNPTTTWAAHKIRTNDAGSTTTLYIESSPRITLIRAALGERGIRLDSAYPLLTVFESAFPVPIERPSIGVLYTDEAAAVYWSSPSGERHARFFTGDNARERALEDLHTGFSLCVGHADPAFAIVNLASTPFDLSQALPDKDPKVFSATEFLSHADNLKLADLGNLVPAPSPISPTPIAYGVSVLVTGIALLVAFLYVKDIQRIRQSEEAQRQQEELVSQEVERLRVNREKADAMNAILAEANKSRPVKLTFLESLHRARSVPVSIRSVNITETTWTITGTVHEGVGSDKGPLTQFMNAFIKNEGWTLPEANRPAVLHQPDFTLTGTIP